MTSALTSGKPHLFNLPMDKHGNCGLCGGGPLDDRHICIAAASEGRSVEPGPDNSLLTRVQDEADLCRNEGANDIANLLDEVASALQARPEAAHGDRIPVRLDAERRAYLILPRPFTQADADECKKWLDANVEASIQGVQP